MNQKIGFIGAGNMATAIIEGILRSQMAEPRELIVYDKSPERCEWMQKRGIEVIVPVPMYAPKQRKRGYNQATAFAKELSRQTGIPVDEGLVIRVKDTTPQKELDDIERKNNLKSAFQNKKSIVQYSHVLVVDDIYTTGSTVEAVAEELIKIGVRRVYVLSICIGGDM